MNNITKIIEYNGRKYRVEIICRYVRGKGLVTELSVYHLNDSDNGIVLICDKEYVQKPSFTENKYSSAMLKDEIVDGIRNYERELSKINNVVNWDGVIR